jgi:quinol monooxygenase YgiN
VLVSAGRWSAEQNFIADLVKLLASQGTKASRQTVQRAVTNLHRETGDHRYHRVDQRKQPDESVWESFEDLAERRRRQHQK